jgi:gluconokinase
MKPAAPDTASVHAPIVVVMGVAGSGKSTVARLLAEKLHCPMLEGDSLHPPENVRRMAGGTALTDLDRAPWLSAIQARIATASLQGKSLVVSCSALKRRYRDVLRLGDPPLIFVHLAGDPELMRRRMSLRPEHFMPAALLDSQFAALEVPGADEYAIRCNAEQDPQQIVDSVLAGLASARLITGG